MKNMENKSMKNLTTIIILILLFITAGSVFYNVKSLKIMEENKQKILQQEQTIKSYQAKEESKQRQYEACLKKCDSAFPNIIIELKELNAMYIQTCKLECKENYGM